MDVAISGSHGLIGSRLATSLRTDGHTVRGIVRSPGGSAPAGGAETAIGYDPETGAVDLAALEGVDAVVNLAGAPIASRPFTARHRESILQSRVRVTDALAKAVGRLDRKPAVMVSGSAVGIYGAHRGDEVLTEASTLGDDFLAELCQAWERAAQPVDAAGVRLVLARTGIVLTRDGGALKPQLVPFKLGLGGPAGPGDQWMAWITLDDEVAALRFLLDNEVDGPVNLTAPTPVRNGEFATTLGRVLHRPAKVRIPALLAKAPAAIGDLVDNLLLASQRVSPGALTTAGFTFADPTLEPALRTMLTR